MDTVRKNTGLTNLPSALGKGNTVKKIWNIYRQFRTNIHYYHMAPYKHIDILVRTDINPNRGIEIVNMCNIEVQKKK